MLGKKVESVYRARVFARYDENPALYLYSAEDFEGLNDRKMAFGSKKGNKLSGHFYYYDSPIENRLVVFEHGVGSGHRNYMREIETIARRGYAVFAYDHTGCGDSEGENIGGFSQSVSDLDDALTMLKKLDGISGFSFSVVGHSWGALAAVNIPLLHPDLESIVAISPPISVASMLEQILPFPMSFYRKRIYAVEQRSNPDFVALDARNSLSDYQGRVLVVHSADDGIVNKKFHFDRLRERFESKEGFSFLLTDGREHNPNYTVSAVRRLDEMFASLSEKLKKGELSDLDSARAFRDSFDWGAITEQDEEIWDEIFKIL